MLKLWYLTLLQWLPIFFSFLLPSCFHSLLIFYSFTHFHYYLFIWLPSFSIFSPPAYSWPPSPPFCSWCPHCWHSSFCIAGFNPNSWKQGQFESELTKSLGNFCHRRWQLSAICKQIILVFIFLEINFVNILCVHLYLKIIHSWFIILQFYVS